MPPNNVKVSELQKNKMLEFFERYPLLVTGTSLVPAKRRQAHRLWRELAVILNNCDPDGSKKSLRVWLKTLADLKSKAKKKVLAKARNISNFQRRLYELAFGPPDEETSKAMKSRDKYSVEDTSMEIETLDEDDNPLENIDDQVENGEEEEGDEETYNEEETKYKDTEEFHNGITTQNEPMIPIHMDDIKQDMEQNLEMQRQTLEVNRRTLEVQQRMLESERELVDAVKQGVNVIQSVVRDRMQNIGNSNSKTIVVKNHRNGQNVKDISTEENEFEAFAKNISVQLQKLPLESALETQQVIQKIVKDQRIKALQERNDRKISIRILDDKFPAGRNS